jgi:hypothetical protein
MSHHSTGRIDDKAKIDRFNHVIQHVQRVVYITKRNERISQFQNYRRNHFLLKSIAIDAQQFILLTSFLH